MRLRQLRLLLQHVTSRHGAKLELLVQEIELLLLGVDDVELRRDLRPQRGLPYRGDYHVGDQRQIGRFKLEARPWDGRWHCFDLEADPFEQKSLGAQGCGDLPALAREIYGRLPGRKR